MRISHVLSLLCGAATLIAAAPAAADEPQAKAATKQERSEPQKKICRWLPVTGSNMNQKVCLTEQDWKKAEAQSW